ncbi:MAG TPA: glycosyl hydrolase family 28 protein [Tepidisphaeraceae bacterium]|jgi:hypothetical protein
MRFEKLENRRLLSIALPSIPGGTFLVTSYGAVADGATNNATAIQAAITAATKAGGGTVEFPAATKSYESGPLNLASNINFQIDAGAELQAIPYSSYPNAGKTSVTNFITAKNLSNFEITGSGTIDGNGSAWWTAYNANNAIARPRLIQITNCNTILVQNVTLQNPAMFHLYFDNTNTVTINGITINTPATSPNTDGIDPAGQHYLIENCSISDGDDNIAIKPEDVFCGDITISNCFFGVGHGLSVGGETNDGLNGLTVTNCTFYGTTAGIRLKAARGEGGLVQNCTYSNITMTDVEYPININSYYNIGSVPTNPQDPAQTVTALTPIWQNITITGVTSTWDTTGGEYTNSYCGIIWGLPEETINNVTLTNVNLTAKYGLDVDHVRNLAFDVTSHFNAASTNSLISTNTASTPYDATISEFANISGDNQSGRVVTAGSLLDYFSNNTLQAAINPALLTGFAIYPSGDNDTVTLDYSAGNFPLPVSIDAAALSDDSTLALLGASSSDPFTITPLQITHTASTVALANISAFNLSTGTFTLAADLNNASLQVGNNATAEMQTDQHLSNLSFSSNGTLAIGPNTIYLAQTGPAADASIFRLLQASHNANWNGPGITSNSTVGYYDNNSQILIRQAVPGDANLDGTIDSDDLSLIMLGQVENKTDWFFGNFNYDAQVNADDWSLLQKFVALQNAPAQPTAIISTPVPTGRAGPSPARANQNAIAAQFNDKTTPLFNSEAELLNSNSEIL